MKKLWLIFWLCSAFTLSGCTGGFFSTCDPRFEHCRGEDPHMQDEIADEVGQML